MVYYAWRIFLKHVTISGACPGEGGKGPAPPRNWKAKKRRKKGHQLKF